MTAHSVDIDLFITIFRIVIDIVSHDLRGFWMKVNDDFFLNTIPFD
jgi:hypothetical protein